MRAGVSCVWDDLSSCMLPSCPVGVAGAESASSSFSSSVASTGVRIGASGDSNRLLDEAV